MVRGLLVLLACQLVGQFVVTTLGVPVPGPVVGMVILPVALKVRRPGPRSPVVKTADALLGDLQLLFIPAGARCGGLPAAAGPLLACPSLAGWWWAGWRPWR